MANNYPIPPQQVLDVNGRAKQWWNAQIPTNVTTWEQVVQKFLARYFPTSKATKLKNDIVCFQQEEDEMVGEAWERFQGLLRNCPNHSFPRHYMVQTFHNGLTPSTQTILDISVGEAFDKKHLMKPISCWRNCPLINTNHIREDKLEGVAGVHEVDAQTKQETQIASLTIQLEQARK
ncbi:hypothetical protein LIER_27362 [Lithospermum erythrorhizon]|uniref:Retrotransposon gag domain-containing protein n=1 Tax=Lithospermum erythrorhizon TaxID=34254 RepID=A0AAV3RDB7_LITER